ncbi:MAG: hypothetical protein Kow0010_11340 [Dehalococcoidia bacterium]
MVFSRGSALAVAAALVTLAVACGGGSGEPASPARVDGRPVDATPPAVESPAPPAAAPTEAPPDGSPNPGDAATSTPTPTPPPQTSTPASAPTRAPAATPTATPIASDITVTVGPDCSFAPNPASVQLGGVVRFANGASYIVEVAVFFANDAGFDGAEVEPGELSSPIPAAHAGRAELTCEGPGLQFARGVLFVVSPQP